MDIVMTEVLRSASEGGPFLRKRIVEDSAIVSLVDSSGGPADGTIADVSTVVTGVDGTANNAASKADVDTRLGAIDVNFANVAANQALILAALRAHGIVAD